MPKYLARLALAAGLINGLVACSDNNDQNSAINPCAGIEAEVVRLFLQQLTDSSVIVKWRGDASAACFGNAQDSLNTYVEATSTDGDHKEAYINGLNPETMYYYSVGGAPTAPADQYFTTSPTTGNLPADGTTRIWLIGDSGTGGDDEREDHEGEALEVLAGMQSYIADDGQDIDLFLMLGDNAYTVGSDFNYQQAVFETYPELLKNFSVWPTIGNHEMGFFGVSSSPDPESYIQQPGDEPSGMPYLDIFTLPTDGETGGVASGTEQFYSFDYGNVHIVSLDSQLSARDDSQRAAMRSWVIDDLSANTSDWTVVIFHHPPYSKGSNHDSDTTETRGTIDVPQRLMREEFVSVFDDYGVDVVYGGHSHSYERSYYLSGHTGKSDTFSPAEHAELIDGEPASGRDGEGYAQLSPTSGGVDDRVVYTVAGNGGKADEDAGRLTNPAVWLRHPAHIEQPADTATPKHRGVNVLGSVVLDASADRLQANFINTDGVVLDSFSITR
ncbi:MAG: hypothetical protein ACI9JM_000643 [Halioglobus sp.]|jgi:hypothetical protein